MNRYFFIFKLIVICSLIILSGVVLYYFFYYSQWYEWNSIEIRVSWMTTIIYFIISFYILLLFVDFNFYNKIFGYIVTIGAILWIGIYIFEFFKFEPRFWNWTAIRNSSAILCISILAPGFTLNMIKFIKNNSNQNRKRRVFKNYHIHESFAGILFFFLAIFLLLLRYILIQYQVIKKQLRIILAVDIILLFLFLFSGSFLIFRDRRDLIKLIFIESRDTTQNSTGTSVFNPITPDSIPFFTSPRILYYPFGILLSSFSVSLLVHGTDFFAKEIFGLNHETIVFIGFVLCFVAGGMIGIDWYRLFAKLYPKLYHEIEQILDDFKKVSKSRKQG